MKIEIIINKMRAFLLCGIMLLFYFYSSGQTIEIDKKYEITGAAKKGLLAHVEFDKTDGFYRLFYIVKVSDVKVRLINYLFDLDFNFLDMKESIMDIEAVQKKYDWSEDFFKKESSRNKDTSALKISANITALILKTPADSLAGNIKDPKGEEPFAINSRDYELTGYLTDSLGNVFISVQNYYYIAKIVQEKKVMKKVYAEVLVLQFDNKGIFRNQYGVSFSGHDKSTKTIQLLFENAKQSSVYWEFLEEKGIPLWSKQSLRFPAICKIDEKNSTITNPIDLGEVDFYLEPQLPYLYNSFIHTIVFFGSDKTGKWIHIYKCRLE